MGFGDQIIAAIPLWLFRPGLLIALILCCILGAHLRLRFAKQEAPNDPESYILSAVLGLLGLMIAFTFSMALNRYDDRRELVVTEANAIGTAWLRAGLIEEPAGTELQRAISTYAELRSRLPVEGETTRVEQDSARAQADLWRQMREAISGTPSPVAATLVTAMNDMFDIASARKAEREARIPSLVMNIVLLYALLSAAIISYVLGDIEPRHRGVTTILFLLLTLSLALIIDLDRPWHGSITISQQPMADMRASIGSPD